ncbi:MAG: SpoIIE family protein phosphatase [Rhodobacteraceae bacterium]|nr:SpoIIE family protein phosphatase [Paracoccaceae bacterium]
MTTPCKILVVDDEPDLEPLLLQRMRREIRRKEYDFTFAHNGVEALQKLREDDTIQVVLSDINMPEMDGLTLLQEIPSVNPDIRSVIISAYGDMKNIRMAMNRGAFDFVTKPIDFDDLRVTIKRTVEQLQIWHDAMSARDELLSINNELSIASTMQQSILPKSFPNGDNFEISGTMRAARDVGGDFFDIYQLEGDKVGMCIADVSDKGVPAALFMMSSRSTMKGTAIGTLDPADVIRDVNEFLCEDNMANMFVTVLYAIVDTRSGMITYANGGHNPPLVVSASGETRFLPMPEGIALGMFNMSFDKMTHRLDAGDTLIMYTDGVTEAANQENDLYGEERLMDVVSQAVRDGKDDLIDSIMKSIDDFSQGLDQTDDITCISFRFDGYKS